MNFKVVFLLGAFKFLACESLVCPENPECDCEAKKIICRSKNVLDINRFQSLPSDTIELDFSRNNIKEINKAQLNPLWLSATNLSFVDFSSNIIDTIEDGAFDGIKSLEVLDLSRNKIRTLTNLTLSGIQSLRVLYLSKNNLELIEADWFTNMSNLRDLDLSQNPIGVHDLGMYNRVFQHLISLEVLSMSDTKIHELPNDIFSNTKLKELDLSHNPLDHIPSTQVYLVKETLLKLDLTGTNISKIETGEFNGLSSLTNLVMSELETLEEIGAMAFKGLVNLKEIMIQNCPKLKIIDQHAFYQDIDNGIGPVPIENIFLLNNGLISISETLLDYKKAKRVEIGGNPFFCGCSLRWLGKDRRENIQSIHLDNTLICDGPDNYKNILVKDLRSKDFYCPDEHNLLLIFVFASMMLSVSTTLLVIYYRNRRVGQPRSGTKIVMRLERLFNIPIPDIANPLSYRQLNEEVPFPGEIETPQRHQSSRFSETKF